MIRKDKSLPDLNPDVRTRLENSNSPLMEPALAGFDTFRKLSPVPAETEVLVHTPESLMSACKECSRPADVNHQVWGDACNLITLYTTLCVYRAYEQTQSTIQNLNSNNVVAAGTSARSLFEIAMMFAVDGHYASEALAQLPSKKKFQEKVVSYDEEFEKFLNRNIWGARSPDVEEFLRKPSLFKGYIKKVDKFVFEKSGEAQGYADIYQYLSEVSHPYRYGYQAYQTPTDKRSKHGARVYKIKFDALKFPYFEVEQKAGLAMGLSHQLICYFYDKVQKNVRATLKKCKV